ncbi:O-antigen ligase family protein [Cereibacter azotoformans]|uniref:O-antigen ligase n=1 Tax=Cereibacter azotoformans TaxID=43057 RepID=A0A2T5JVV6_9RHOB|nr:O-antigen ligase family protein [Cereibacter azotoformans]PTR14272.1 O-antigen ligase [Cereibacter azotoformans]
MTSIPETGSERPGIAPGRAFAPARRKFLVRLIIVALLIPISFEIASIRLTPSLILMMLLFPALLQQFFTRVVPWRMPDLFFFLFIVWQGLSILINNPERFVAFTGQQTLLTLAGYLAGRLFILDREDFVSFVKFWALMSMISVPFALHEALRDDPILLRMVAEHTPFTTFEANDYEARMGLFRAQFVFSHPIHYGLMGALIIVPYALGVGPRLGGAARVVGTGLIGLATFLSVSSGAVLAVLLQLGVLAWYRIAQKVGPPWRVLLASGSLLYIALELASTKNAFAAISGRLAFNAQTAYYRTLIWDYGSAQIMRTPIFGNGYNYWPRLPWMTASIDNHWLYMAMVHGLPALFLMVGAILYAFLAVNRPGLCGDRELDRMRLAWTLSLIGLCMSASTVALWGELQMFVLLLLGAGFWLADTAADAGASREPEVPDRRLRLTRFPPGTPRAEPARRAAAYTRLRSDDPLRTGPVRPISHTRTDT